MLGVVALDRAIIHSPLFCFDHHAFSSFPSIPSPLNPSSAHRRNLPLNRPPMPSLIVNSASVPPGDLEDRGKVPSDLASVPGEEAGVEGFEFEVEKVEEQKNRRRIRSRVPMDAELETVWRVLTNYEGLADFIPSLAVSRLLDKKDKVARLYQVGQQNLALGFKFNAKGVLDCYEGDLELLPNGWRRDIDFKMVEGDFDTFEGKWSIEQGPLRLVGRLKANLRIGYGGNEGKKIFLDEEFQTTLFYRVDVVPKLWLPVRLIEGRLCSEIKANLLCVREEAQRLQRLKREMLDTC